MKPLHFALAGEDIGYSRSPHIFEAMFELLGREGRFDLCSVDREQLESCVANMAGSGVTGFSVTIPYKQAIIRYLNTVDESARVVDAVNSVAIRDNRLHGYNTDCFGASFALKKAGFTGCGRTLIFGTGGAARAVVYALHRDFDVRRFLVSGRSVAQSNNFKKHFQQHIQDTDIETVSITKTSEMRDPGCGLVVNCTPLGGPHYADQNPLPDAFPWRADGLYFDLNYNENNAGVEQARGRGVKAIDGSTMLVAQAVESLRLWTGLEVAFEAVYKQVFPDRWKMLSL